MTTIDDGPLNVLLAKNKYYFLHLWVSNLFMPLKLLSDLELLPHLNKELN